jgi:hypothetical protein
MNKCVCILNGHLSNKAQCWGIRSSGMLHGVEQMGCLDAPVTNHPHRITSQKSADLNYAAAKATTLVRFVSRKTFL